MKSLFYKPVHVNHDPSNIVVWGCMHYNHACDHWDTPLWSMRGYASLQEHNDALIYNWNHVTNTNSVGFLLGDTMFGMGGKSAFEELLQKLNFKTLFIAAGNHYAGWHQSFCSVDGHILKLSENKTVVFIPNYFEVIINDQPVVMSHYPILSWNGMGRGSYMIYSHVHNTLCQSEIGRRYKNSDLKQYEVSVECNQYPIHFSTIVEHMSNKADESVDHHRRDIANPF